MRLMPELGLENEPTRDAFAADCLVDLAAFLPAVLAPDRAPVFAPERAEDFLVDLADALPGDRVPDFAAVLPPEREPLRRGPPERCCDERVERGTEVRGMEGVETWASDRYRRPAADWCSLIFTANGLRQPHCKMNA